MTDDAQVGVRSTAAIGGHPIHPMLIPLPIGFLSGAFATDLLYASTRDAFWARASQALTAAGLATGLLAAPFGAIDYATRPAIRAHAESHAHAVGNAAVLALAGVSLLVRTPDRERAVVPTGLALSALTAGLLGVTGWLGGEMSYRHGIGLASGRRR